MSELLVQVVIRGKGDAESHMCTRSVEFTHNAIEFELDGSKVNDVSLSNNILNPSFILINETLIIQLIKYLAIISSIYSPSSHKCGILR